MPDVPFLPGVPPLTSYGAAGSFAILTEDAISLLAGLFFGPQWGIFLDGISILPINSVVSFEFRQDYAIATYPVEQGSFETYDKVQLPFDIRVRVASGGDEASRQELLDAIIAAAASMDLYDVVTPEEVYSNCSISHYDYRRAAMNGVGIIVMDIWLQEIQQSSSSTFQSTSSPTVAGQNSQGIVQAQPPSPVVQSDFDAMGGGAGTQ